VKKTVTQIINQWDPIGLFPGAPTDEYSSEIDQICSKIANAKDFQILAIEIHDTFTKAFGSEIFIGNLHQCEIVAKAILENQKLSCTEKMDTASKNDNK
jgi:hypothetical protein